MKTYYSLSLVMIEGFAPHPEPADVDQATQGEPGFLLRHLGEGIVLLHWVPGSDDGFPQHVFSLVIEPDNLPAVRSACREWGYKYLRSTPIQRPVWYSHG